MGSFFVIAFVFGIAFLFWDRARFGRGFTFEDLVFTFGDWGFTFGDRGSTLGIGGFTLGIGGSHWVFGVHFGFLVLNLGVLGFIVAGFGVHCAGCGYILGLGVQFGVGC